MTQQTALQQRTAPVTKTEVYSGPGFAAGSIVLTLKGEMPVENVQIGDRLITRDSGMAVVTSLRKFTVNCHAVGIAAGSLGHTRPDQDVVMPAGQDILIRDWRAQVLFGADSAMIPASRLIDGEFVTYLGLREMTLYQIECATSHVLYVDGLEVGCETFSDVADV